MTLSGTIENETDNALLLNTARGKHWLPFSQINKITRFKNGQAQVTISAWLARKIDVGGNEEEDEPLN